MADGNEGEPMTAGEFELLDEAEATELLCSRFRKLTDAGYECMHALVLAVYLAWRWRESRTTLRALAVAGVALAMVVAPSAIFSAVGTGRGSPCSASRGVSSSVMKLDIKARLHPDISIEVDDVDARPAGIDLDGAVAGFRRTPDQVGARVVGARPREALGREVGE